jgi:glycosyltransferase involved in cell wall biosynthesis
MSSTDTAKRHRVLIIAFNETARDLRVTRQIRTTIRGGYETTFTGAVEDLPVPADLAEAKMIPVQKAGRSKLRQIWTAGLLACSHVVPRFADTAFWSRPWLTHLRDRLLQEPPVDVILANNLEGLAIAAALQDRWPGAKIIFDAHEYFLHLTSGFGEALRSVMRRRVLKRFAPRATVMTTVCEPIAELYERDLKRSCGVVYNASSFTALKPPPPKPWDGTRRLRLVHHGLYAPDRGQDKLVHAVALAPNCELHFYLLAFHPPDMKRLEKLVAETVPDRVIFHSLIKPEEIPAMVRQYDLGMTVIEPTCTNTLHMLPNKFFDALFSGVGVIIGPSPAMQPIVDRYQCGVVTPTFEPADVAAVLQSLTPERIASIHEGAQRAAAEINYETESRKILDSIRQCLPHEDVR